MAKKSSFIAEFKKFISRGNVMDLAVGIIIGTAFTAIVKSLVNDIIMPIVGLVLGGVNFTHLQATLRKAVGEKAPLTLTYGMFIQEVINFFIIAFVVFIIVRSFNKFREKKEKVEVPAPKAKPVVPADIVLLTEIRDLLKKKD
ncbi:MAG: large-conductance mechanosensitive channel protein MscL [Sphaerochaetaceae bacterium]|jgi:large conductance mechanosensitive channel|nr:large-conductance mechanosensitive channel protein MscL [Sphaerochaetaceae bacterium]MDD3366196.1 large-conductance mechanosensitive channel protein MscL [Sphaerochaetaceae bacterium]MDD4218883.1 large-conductance mechanosensitive channel protein MscL [Sphaerochaetaceae bacterium]MDY0371450.1 large-conductance mechanosensitive channel protein MscL [Sphaerochaetaceae bacterium]